MKRIACILGTLVVIVTAVVFGPKPATAPEISLAKIQTTASHDYGVVASYGHMYCVEDVE